MLPDDGANALSADDHLLEVDAADETQHKHIANITVIAIVLLSFFFIKFSSVSFILLFICSYILQELLKHWNHAPFLSIDLKGENDGHTDALIAYNDLTSQGNQYAQYQLGKLYLLGQEVERDEEAAVRWFTLSAAQGNEYAQWFLDHCHEFRGPTPTQCVIRLLHHMSRIFHEQSQRQAEMGMEVDRKIRQKIREKKIAMGHKPDDHLERQTM